MSRFPNYGTALKYLYNVNSRLKAEGILAPNSNSLANTKHLYQLIGKPLDYIPTIHIGGTNGKGTTCYKFAQSLIHSGMKVGLFVSPHILSFRERIQVNNNLIPQEDFMQHLERVISLCETYSIPATQFEITFIMSCLQYEAQQCDAVVLEVGCGGEWDATNVILSSLSIVCSVGLDHMRILGDTIELIATNKAGIFKPHVPALIGPGCPYDVMKEVASQRNTPLFQLNDLQNELHMIQSEANNDTDYLNSQITLAGLSLLKNYLVSLPSESIPSRQIPSHIIEKFRTLNLHDTTFLQIILNSRPPCRWQEIDFLRSVSHLDHNINIKMKIILDIAHNPPAIHELMNKVQNKLTNQRIRLLYGMSRDKDIETCLAAIVQVIPVDRIHFVQSNNFRAVSVEILQSILAKLSTTTTAKTSTRSDENDQPTGIATQEQEVSPLELAVSSLIAETLANLPSSDLGCDGDSPRDQIDGGVVLVCGSGYIMSNVYSFLNISQPNDYSDMKDIS